MRCLPGGNEAKDDARRQGEDHGESQDRAVEFDLAHARNVLRHRGHECVGPPLRDKEPEQPAHRREEDALRKQLPDDAAPARPERAAQCDFLPTHRCARQHQVGDVRVRDQKQAGDRAEQNVEPSPNIAHEFVPEGLQPGTELRIRFRVFFLERRGDRLQLGIRLDD